MRIHITDPSVLDLHLVPNILFAWSSMPRPLRQRPQGHGPIAEFASRRYLFGR
jgi:hypothetical protein